MEQIKELWASISEGTVELSKREVILGIGFCVTAGLLVGIVAAPFTRGINVFSYNGVNHSKNPGEDKDKGKEQEKHCCQKRRKKL